jgi:hypothetical protein
MEKQSACFPLTLHSLVQPAPVNTRLRIYLGIQYMLNAILAIAIIALMILTIVKYNSTKNVVGAWPASPVLSPTILMIVVSCINVIVDSANLLVQCCGAKIIRKMAYIATKAHTITSAITALLPAVAAGYSAIAQTTSNGADLWSFSCSPPAAQMVAVNSSDTICAANVSLPSFSTSVFPHYSEFPCMPASDNGSLASRMGFPTRPDYFPDPQRDRSSVRQNEAYR